MYFNIVIAIPTGVLHETYKRPTGVLQETYTRPKKFLQGDLSESYGGPTGAPTESLQQTW